MKSTRNTILNIKKNFSETDKDSKDLMIYFFKFTIEKSDISILEQLNKPLMKFETNNLNVEVKIRLGRLSFPNWTKMEISYTKEKKYTWNIV